MPDDERAVAPGIEVWHAPVVTGAQRILPDGCLDLLFDGERLLVAGPDTAARVHHDRAGADAWGAAARRPWPGPARGPGRRAARPDACRSTRSGATGGRVGSSTERVGGDLRVARWPRGRDQAGRRTGSGCAVRTLLDRGGCRSRTSPRKTGYSAASAAPSVPPRVRLRPAAPRPGCCDWAGRCTRPTPVAPGREVAQRAGYADQAHLARDVRALAGITPTGLRDERVRSVQDAATERAPLRRRHEPHSCRHRASSSPTCLPALAFYRRLGLEIPAEADGKPHVEVDLGGVRLAFDTRDTIRSFDPRGPEASGGPRMSLAFQAGSPAEVDEAYAALTAAGAEGCTSSRGTRSGACATRWCTTPTATAWTFSPRSGRWAFPRSDRAR